VYSHSPVFIINKNYFLDSFNKWCMWLIRLHTSFIRWLEGVLVYEQIYSIYLTLVVLYRYNTRRWWCAWISSGWGCYLH